MPLSKVQIAELNKIINQAKEGEKSSGGDITMEDIIKEKDKEYIFTK